MGRISWLRTSPGLLLLTANYEVAFVFSNLAPASPPTAFSAAGGEPGAGGLALGASPCGANPLLGYYPKF